MEVLVVAAAVMVMLPAVVTAAMSAVSVVRVVVQHAVMVPMLIVAKSLGPAPMSNYWFLDNTLNAS